MWNCMFCKWTVNSTTDNHKASMLITHMIGQHIEQWNTFLRTTTVFLEEFNRNTEKVVIT